MLLVGSRALQSVEPSLLDREPLDWDFICRYSDFEDFLRSLRSAEIPISQVYPTARGKKMVVCAKLQTPLYLEFEIAWPGSTAESLLQKVREGEGVPPTCLTACRVAGKYLGHFITASLDVLFTLKKSHRFLKDSPHFLKTRRDFMVMRAAGAKVSKELEDWYREREKETYWYKHPNLNQKKDMFFSGDQVKYVYDHDTIHVSVARGGAPAYTLFKREGAEVAVDREKWDRLDEADRLRSVVEESLVLAIERSQVPHPGVLTPVQSFKKALMKVCTSITSGWWREYAYENYDRALDVFTRSYSDYMDVFWEDVAKGVVKKLPDSAGVHPAV